MDAAFQTKLDRWISAHTECPYRTQTKSAARGGCIHQSYVIEGDHFAYFVKVNHASALELFEAEAAALRAIHSSSVIRVPEPLGTGQIDGHAFLIMERLQLTRGRNENWQQLGQQLAALHQSSADHFGWHRDNFIGSSPQYNSWTDNWADFFKEQRLRPQLEMLQSSGIRLQQQEALFDSIDERLKTHAPLPSLLHGDLWSGNTGFLSDGTPVIYDPACYYGDRETDLAFSELFGGFPDSFYKAYSASWPLLPGYETRKPLYILYHLLNHAQLFGGNYIRQAQQTIDGLCL